MTDTKSTRVSNEGQAPIIGEALRILSVITRFSGTGPPLAGSHFFRGSKKVSYHTVTAATPCATQDSNMSYLLTGQDNVESSPAMPRFHAPCADLFALLHLVRLLRQYKPDSIQFHTFNGNTLRRYLGTFLNWCTQKIEHLPAAGTAAWSVLSRRQHREIAVEFSIAEPQKVRILPLGLPLAAFATLPPPPMERAELVVAWFGRLVAVKNVPLLVASD